MNPILILFYLLGVDLIYWCCGDFASFGLTNRRPFKVFVGFETTVLTPFHGAPDRRRKLGAFPTIKYLIVLGDVDLQKRL